MEVLEAQAPGNRDLVVTLVQAIDIQVVTRQVHNLWMGLIDPAGEEKVQTGIWNSLVRSWMLMLKDLEILIRGEARKARKVII